MTKNQRLLISAVVIAAVAQMLPILGISSNLLAVALVAANLLISFLGFRDGRYRIFWLIWGLLTVIAFVLFGLTGPLSLVTVTFFLLGH